MKTSTLYVLIALLIGGVLTGCVMPVEHGMEWHEFGVVEMPEGLAVPTIAIELTEDANSGWNLHILTESFVFAPEHASTEHYPGEGHAHIYINGKMHARVYGVWFHVPQLGPGRHQILVTLNSNDHHAYAVKGKMISDTAIVTVEDSPGGYSGEGGSGYSY